MFAKREKVASRRIKRRMKAAASIVVALAAGTFLACQRGVEHVKEVLDSSKPEIDASRELAPPPQAADAGGADTGTDAADANIDDARADVVDAGKDARVDVREHRKGMPVRDNLLE